MPSSSKVGQAVLSSSNGSSTLHPLVILSLVLLSLVIVYFSILRFCYQSYSIKEVLAKYQKRRQLEEAYSLMFQRREDMCFHRDWATSRGDFTEAKRLETEVVHVEAELDKLDDQLGQCDLGVKRE